ncbi:PREDICTED: tumor necrosis factor receptor superfamily member 16-like [Gekko japonicus]|uniref:Tumor necrosis factor receptor superfamily member 16-like n=1 Tax=Gekko japonicus TaxID=146911 RepID=A0ABM1KWZ0_GEKJA|nr:PREDICTED: tumor necrosis factor receptor superfamily member 16-like [Gekko japonicus]
MKLTRSLSGGLFLCLLQLWAAEVLANQGCENGHVTSTGDCCDLCPPGYGVTVPCGNTNTKCEPCIENMTFSSVASATKPCQPCSMCPGHVPRLEVCTPTHDTVCAVSCPQGQYLHARNGSHGAGHCRPCQVCPEGYGAVQPCGPNANTMCQKCPKGYYSEEKSSLEPCLRCRLECHESEVMIQECTPHSDTLCMDKELQILKRTEGDSRKEFPKRTSLLDSEGSPSPNSSSSEFVPPLAEDHSKNIIPVYCSILAAVVVGLLAYVAFKWPHTSGLMWTENEYKEKSLQKAEPQLYANLPPHKREEVEQLLETPGHGKDWRCLADRLGYEEETVATFGRGEAPAHTLLSDWSAREGATLETLCTALAAIEREDVVENLNAPAEVSSVV